MENKQYRAVLWDMDGTLFNTQAGIEKTLSEALEIMGLSPIPEDKIRFFIGPPISVSMEEIYGLSREKAVKVASLFREIYRDKGYVYECTPYEGIPEALSAISKAGVKQGIATLKKQDMAEKICERYGIHVDCIYGTDPKDNLKKHDIIRLCMEKLGVYDPSEAVLIGDSRYDAEGAVKAGCPFLGVTYGFGFLRAEDMSAWPVVGAAATPAEVCALLGI